MHKEEEEEKKNYGYALSYSSIIGHFWVMFPWLGFVYGPSKMHGMSVYRH